ncbi:MAG: head GIN domain-containing protein [Sphaerochaeta sp.]|nr:head GIN domain-containing protein [Sphaerochaeta sp.]
MLKTVLVIVLSTAALGATYASVALSVQHRTVAPFSAIALNGMGTVNIHQGPQSVVVTVDESVIDRYETIVQNGTLNVGFGCTFSLKMLRAMKHLEHCTVDITVPDLQRISVNGSGNLVVDSFSGDSLRIDITGAGTVVFAGSCDDLEVNCTGSAVFKGGELQSKNAKISSTGAANIQVKVEETLSVKISGAGDVTYWGNPRITQRISGAGSLHHGI